MVDDSKQGPALGLTELIDKDLQVSMITAALRRERLGGTLLLFGSQASGKSSLAFWLAASLNCERSGGTGPACRQCNSCRKIDSLNHPDLFWVFPVPGNFYSGGHPDEGKLAGIFEQKRARPWSEVEFAEKAEHHLAAVSRIRDEASRSPYEARRKVFVITGADRLRTEAANAFLKLLEEPHRNVAIVLTSDRPAGLLPTILSRCQRLHVTRPRMSTLAEVLQKKFGFDQGQARELLAAAEGNLASALRLKEEGAYQAQMEWVDRTLEAVLEPAGTKLLDLCEDRRGPMFNRGDFERYAALLARRLREALLEHLSPGRAVEAPGTGYTLRVADSRALIKLLGRLVNLHDSLNRNVNLRLLGWSLLNEMRGVIGGATG
ncbi:MAG: hypothetical protein V1794_02050 [Candidatus Glassbacteria bacterium]